MQEALVSPKLIHWARERSALSPEDVSSAGITPDQVRNWEAGIGRGPTLRQASRLANALKVPLGYLFLKEPPALPEPLADLRTLPETRGAMSADLRQVINDAKVKQDWYRDHLLEEGAEPLDFVGRFDPRDEPKVIADSIRAALGLEAVEGRVRAPSWGRYLKDLTDRAEEAGITVLRSGIVRNNTHRPLEVSEFRGFAIPDLVAPLVFINSRDFVVAQIFTLVHELAHVWLGVEGVSDLEPGSPLAVSSHRSVESLCNSVAAEVLMPEGELRAVWRVQETTEDQLRSLAARFRVSEVVVLLRARDLGLVTRREFSGHFERLRGRVVRESGGDGGNFRFLFPLRNGRNLSAAMIVAALNGSLALHDAARMLGVRVGTLQGMAEEYGLR